MGKQNHSGTQINGKSVLTFNPSPLRHVCPGNGGVMRFNSLAIALEIVVVCLLAGILALLHAAETNEVVEWIRANAIRLETPAAGHGFADMQPLKKVIGNARIVALGEATHGTREFFQLKHRMLEFLATEMGFSIFSIEANMPEAYRLNDYVLSGKGDPVKLIKGMYFWTWDTQEVLDMVKWMREFNQSGKGRLQFTGFDMQTPNVAAAIVGDFVTSADPAYADSLRRAADLARNASPAASGPAFGVATATFPVKDAAGKRIRFSGYIKTDGVTAGYAGLWWRVDGPSGVLAFDNMQSRGVSGTSDWRRYDIELPVAATATNINFGALFPGHGTAWFDDLTVELDGTPYANNDMFDLDFESSSPKGFYTGGNGYRVQLDSQVFHNGKQSLRMTWLPAATDQKRIDPKLASSAWKDVVRHLETSREAYGKKGAEPRDIEWAIQNARVVLQSMQMFGNEVTRDKSMADNIKWILDSNPGAKIVLWAHNGHVSAHNPGGFIPMGASLREMFGAQMVVFGFAFNKGSFQAIEQGKGLRDFTVPPSPEGSLDATFAAAGIPIFALDLRAAPKSGPVARWLSEPHMTRSIGAVFSETSAAQFLVALTAPQSFDAMLFVEKTSAAVKNPAVSVLTCPIGDQAGQPTTARDCRDLDFGLSFKLPAGWRIDRSNRFGEQETTIAMSRPPSQMLGLWYKVMKPQGKMSPEEIRRVLAVSADEKAVQRVDQGLADYRIRPDSRQARSVGGHPALSCIADFTQDGRKMSEYLTWIRAEIPSRCFLAACPLRNSIAIGRVSIKLSRRCRFPKTPARLQRAEAPFLRPAGQPWAMRGYHGLQ